MPIFESVFGGQKKRYNIPADKVEEFKGKRPDAIEITNKPEPIETIGFGVRRAGEVGKLGAEPMGQEKAVAATIPQWPEKPGERTRRGIADYESALKRTNELLKNPNLTPEQRQDILYQFKIAYGTLNHEDNPRITQDARAYLEQEGAGDVASQFKSLGNAFSLDRGWDISGRLKDIGAGLGLTQDPGTSIREHKKVKNYLGKTAAGQRDVRAEQEYLAHLDRLEKELEEKIRSFEKEKIAGRRPKSDYAEMVQASVGAIPFGAHSEEDKAAIPVSDSYEKDAAILETAKRELKKVRQMRERAFDAENKSRLDQMLGEIYRRGGDTISDAVSLGSRRTLAEKEKNLALKDGENNIAREASELAMETDRMLAHKITVGQAVAGGAMESVPYMAEFAATKGIAKMLKPATAARVAELASKGGWKAAAKLGYHNMNIAATMIPFQPSTYARAYEMANEEAVANGAPAGGALDYVGRAMAEQFITNASEMAGDVFESILPNKAASGVGKASRWKKARKIAANATGVHGIPSEFVEEKAEEIGQAATGVGDTTWADMVDPRRNIITLGTVAFSQLPVQTITAMGYTAGKANNAITISNIRKGYNKNVSNMLDVFGDESKEAMETVESFVSSYGNSQEAVMAFDHAILESDEYTDAEKSAMLNYAMAYAPMVGVDKEARERAGGYVAKAASAIEQSVNKDMDAVVTIRMDKNAAVLVGGKIVQKEDGSIDKDNSDKTLYYRDENGRVHPIGIDAVDEVVESVPRAEALQQASNAVSENVVKDTANAQAVERAVGEEVAFVVDGTSAVGVGVVQAMDDAGNYVVAMPDGSVSTVEPRQLVDEEVARMENGATILYADADGAKKKGVVADGFNYQGEGLIVLEDGTKVPFESILGVLENENQDAMGEAVVTPSERESAEVSPVEEEGMSATQEEVDVYADFPKRKNGEIDSDKLTDEQSLIYAEREHGEEFAVESAQAAIDALGKKRNEVSDKMNAEGSVAKRADMQSQIKIIDKRIGVYQEYLKNREKVQDLEPSEETVADVKKEDVQKNIPENDLSLPKENTNISRDEVSKSVSQRHDGSLPERDRGMEEESDSFRGGFEASIRNAQTDKGVISEQEIAKAARAFAKKKGRWVPLANLTELGAPFPSGMENDVYYNDREGSVYKVNNLSLHRNNILSILERIDLHNQLFPNTEYSLFGFAGFENGTVYPILKQDFVPNADFATPEEIDGYMHSMGFENSEREAEYSNGKYVVSDLRPRNVLKSLSGNFYVIDAGVELNSGELPEKQEVLSQSEDVNPLFSELEEEVNRLSELFHTPVRVHYSPETIQNATARKAAEDGLAKGWYVDGEVHIYLPNATGVEDIQETFFHEVVAHKGVKDMLGDKHSELMDALFDLIPESEQNRLLDLYGEKHIAADEYLAELAERGGFESEESRGIISKIIDAIREFLSRYHIQISAPTAEDIANSLLKESAARLTEKRKEEDAPKFNGNILSYARDLHKRNQLREAARDVEKSPSKAQQEAGNYKKGHVNVQGFDISIENPKGSTRSGVDESGKKWSITMQNDYGYFKRSEGKDGDPIDVFIGNNPESGKIFVVDQVNPETGVFDESKVMLGFNNEEDARKAYLSNYEDGWQGLGSITETDANYFKEWLYDGKKQRKAFSEYKEVVMKNKQHDRFREIVESENEKEHGWFESVMSDQQLPEERTKNNIKGVPEEFVGDDKNRPVLTGVYHSNGMISASDGLVLISEEKKYPKKDEGLIKSENGIIDGKYPSVEKVIPNMDVYSEFDAGSLVSFVERVETALKSEWSKKDRYGKRIDHRTYKVKRSNTYVVLRINGRDFVVRFDQLDKMAKAAKRLGINKIGGDVGRIHITGGNNHLVASSIVPLVFLKEFPDAHVFAYDLTGDNAGAGDVRFRMSDEESRIKERAIVDDTFMKAPNGQPTNLNERQWFQVRTKAFKNWFGDWEKSARIEKLRKAKPVEITGKEVKPSDDLKQYKKNASEYGKTLQGLYVNKDTGKEIQLQRGRKNGGINEVLQHDYKNAEHLQSIAAIPAIIENSVYIDTQDNTDLFKNPGVREYQYYVCGLKIGSEDYTVRATIAVDNKGDRYYDHKLTQVEKGKLLDLIENQAALNNGFGATPDTKSTTTFSGYKDTNLISLLQNDSSKVVDENGEPLVVYHGTNNDKTIRIWDDKTKTYDTRHEPFTVFKRVNEGEKNRGHFFNSNADNAGGYGYNTYDVFLSLKHPLVIDAHGDNYSGVKHRGEEKDTYEWAEYAESKGYDGVVFLNISDGVGYGDLQNTTNDYVSFNSSQIKSATDNTGAFDEKNNDIRFRLTDVPIIDTEDLKNGIRRENRFHRTMDKFYEAYQDTYLPVKRLYERIAAQGVKVEDWENFYAQATHIPGKNQAEIEVYTSKYMNPMIEQVKALQDKGLSFREIENYVMLKHGMERNEYMRDRESSKYLKKHPRATATKFDELKSKDYAGVRDIAREVGGLDDIPEIGTAEGIAEEFVRDIEAKCGNESIGSFWDAVTAATRFSLTKSYHSGILSKDGYDELISRYKYYVPLRGHDAITAEDKWDYISESGSPTFSSPIKRAKGRSSRAESPFAFIFQTAQSAIMAGNKNRLKSTLLNLAESGKAGTLFNISRAWYEKAGTDEQGNDAWQLAIPKYDDDPVVYAENIASFEERMKEESKKGNAVQGRRKLDLGGMFIKPSQAAEHEIHIRRNGEDLVMYVNADPALARSVNGTNRVMSDSRFMHGARWSTRQIAAMSTSLNPLFTASNFMRDLQYSVMKLGAEKGGAFTAGYSVRLGRILFKDKVLVRMLNGQLDLSKKYDQYAYEFLMNGGKTGYVSALNLETAARRIEKELKRLGVRELSALNPAKEAYLASKCARAVGDFFVMSNEITENSIRLAAYITSRESGESIINSVNTAKEVTVNFNRRGSGAMGADIVNSLFMFTNVAFQALDNFAKIAIRHKWKIAAVMATYMLSGLLQSWWIDEWGSDDSKEAYWGTSDWDRQNNLCVPVGRGLLKIPHPQELRALRGLGVGIYQSIKGTKSPEDTVLDLLSAVADVVPMGSTFVPSEASVSGVATAVSPTVLQPVTQWVTNMNFKGSPVRNAYAPEYAPGHLQARTNRKGEPRADKWIYDLCEFINVSVGRGDGAKKGWIDLNPDAVQHFAGGYFGGLFSTASGTVNTIYMAKSYDDARGLRIRDTPLRRFYAETADMNNVDSGTMSKYYDLSKKADQAHYMFGRYKKQLQDKSLTPEDYREKIEELNYPYWKSIRDELSAIRRLERRLKDVAEDEQVKLDMKSAEMKRRLVKRFEKDMEVKHEE